MPLGDKHLIFALCFLFLMKYLFFLGRVPALSLAEIQAVFEKLNVEYKVDFLNPDFIILDIFENIDFKELLPQMGGTIKIAEALEKYDGMEKLFNDLTNFAGKNRLIENKTRKLAIGYSIYFTQKIEKEEESKIFQDIRNGFIKVKKLLYPKYNLRLIIPSKNGTLNSASVIKNKLLKKGAEFNLVFLNDSEKIILSKTIAVQDIESYSMRDYGRPERDMRAGMMPPKLAQIMINLAQVKESQTILDPFCGIGTILQEALLNDHRVIGSDADEKQIVKTKKNLDWLSIKYILKYPDYKIFQADAGSISKRIKQNSIDAIVTESVLGPSYSKTPPRKIMEQNYKNLKKIYFRFFQSAKSVLKKKARIVITIPAYRMGRNYKLAPLVDSLAKIGYSIVCPLDKRFFIKGIIETTYRNSIIYDRPDQIVAREVMVFENR